MCYVPGATELAVASFAMSAVSSVVSHMGAAAAANDANAAYSQNAASAITAYQSDIEASQMEAMASEENSNVTILQARREALAARAQNRASASERGVGGMSVAAIEQAIGFQAGEDTAYAQRNLELDRERYRLSGNASAQAATGRINSAPTARAPSALALVANLGSSAVNAYSMHSGLKADERRTAASGRT